MAERSSPITRPEEFAAAYDDWWGQWRAVSAEGLRRERQKTLPYHDAAIQAARGAFVGASVLDIGCGNGSFARQLLLGGAVHVTGIDVSEVAIEIAKKLCSDVDGDVVFEQGDIESIARPRASFDVIFSCETLEHVLRPRAALAELKRVLRPHGRLIVTTPNYLSPKLAFWRAGSRLRGRTYTEGGQPVNNLTTWPRTAWWLKRSGFHVEYFGPLFSQHAAFRAAVAGYAR